jgi:hypothetical protein
MARVSTTVYGERIGTNLADVTLAYDERTAHEAVVLYRDDNGHLESVSRRSLRAAVADCAAVRLPPHAAMFVLDLWPIFERPRRVCYDPNHRRR